MGNNPLDPRRPDIMAGMNISSTPLIHLATTAMVISSSVALAAIGDITGATAITVIALAGGVSIGAGVSATGAASAGSPTAQPVTQSASPATPTVG